MYPDQHNEAEYSDDLEQSRHRDYDQPTREGQDEVPEVRLGVLDTRDLEANPEKKQTPGSIKDPNLV